MLKPIVALFAIALAGASSGDEWRSLRIDASSEAAFKRSLTAFKDELSREQRQAFGDALKDIWIEGTQAADAERGNYRAADYYRQIHGLSYEEVVNRGTGAWTALRRQAAASAAAAARSTAPPNRYSSPWEGVPAPPSTWQPRGGTDLFGPGPSPQ